MVKNLGPKTQNKIWKFVSKNKQNFKSIIDEFTIENSQGDIEIVKPELRIYNQPNISTSEADIKTNLFSDKFMTMNIVQIKIFQYKISK